MDRRSCLYSFAGSLVVVVADIGFVAGAAVAALHNLVVHRNFVVVQLVVMVQCTAHRHLLRHVALKIEYCLLRLQLYKHVYHLYHHSRIRTRRLSKIPFFSRSYSQLLCTN